MIDVAGWLCGVKSDSTDYTDINWLKDNYIILAIKQNNINPNYAKCKATWVIKFKLIYCLFLVCNYYLVIKEVSNLAKHCDCSKLLFTSQL